MKKSVCSELAPQPIGAYSQAIAVGPWLFLSGQIPFDPQTNTIISGDIKAQTQRVMNNIEAVLKAHKMDFNHVVKSTIFLTDDDDFALVNEVYSSCFTEPFPARSCVAVWGLPKNVDVEIEIVAYK